MKNLVELIGLPSWPSNVETMEFKIYEDSFFDEKSMQLVARRFAPILRSSNQKTAPRPIPNDAAFGVAQFVASDGRKQICVGILGEHSISKPILEISRISPPLKDDGNRFDWRVDVHNGKSRSIENWLCTFALANDPLTGERGADADRKTLAELAREIYSASIQWDLERSKSLEAERQAANPSIFPLLPETKDHRLNQQQVLEAMAREEWPNFFEAFGQQVNQKGGKPSESKAVPNLLRGYFLDFTARNGIPPRIEDANSLLSDQKFIEDLGEIYRKSGPKNSKLKWELATGWVDRGYYRMDPSALGKAFKLLGFKMSGESIRHTASRLGLKFAVKRGRRSKLK